MMQGHSDQNPQVLTITENRISRLYLKMAANKALETVV